MYICDSTYISQNTVWITYFQMPLGPVNAFGKNDPLLIKLFILLSLST